MKYQDVLQFWFEELKPEQRFKKDPLLDQEIEKRFLPTLEAAISNELYEWRKEPLSALAEIIVLDQFSRNIYRDTPRAFSQDPQGLALALQAIENKFDKNMESSQKAFLYMPLMHSESTLIHQLALKLFSQPGLEANLDFEIAHKKIIVRFGRYPHRNTILSRPSTQEEIDFLKGPHSSF